MKTFKIGSRAFFENMPNYQEHDKDVLFILDQWPEEFTEAHFSCRAQKCDAFFLKQMTKEEYIADVLEAERPTFVCHFLVPEFAQFVGLTIDDLKRVEPVVRKLEGTRHAWYVSLYESYVANGSFTLTDEQRNAAYEIYKSCRVHRFMRRGVNGE